MAENLRNTAFLQEGPPSPDSQLRVDGELWVKSDTLQMYVFNPDIDGDGNPGWVGVTSGQNAGSIIYTGDTPPTIGQIYENLGSAVDPDTALDPLPGTCWYDTATNMLKIWYVYANVSNDLPDDDGGGTGTGNDGAYTGQWVSVTTAHYLTQATQDKLDNMEATIISLTQQIVDLETAVGIGS